MESANIFIYSLCLYLPWIVSCQELTLRQFPESVTRPVGKTAKFLCEVDGLSIINQGLHWYLQDSNHNIKWLLFYKPTQIEIPGEYKNRMSLGINGDKLCTLSITNIQATDDGIYFCAAWHKDVSLKIFGTGTKLSVINCKKVKEPDTPKILSPSVEDIEKKGKGVYLCLLENFFPDVIKVEWYKEGNNNKLASQQDDIKLDNKTQLYSTRSWITVLKSDLGKKFTCKFKHEGVTASEHWKEVSIVKKRNQPIDKVETSEKTVIENKTCDNNATGVVYLNQRSYRAASLAYTLLLVKSAMYSLMLLLFMVSSRHWLGVSKRMNVE
ncbi:M1-specific T cell receptor beta chain [Bombina bombina]|uniref:M1-specific T cell receptor beta chain n=1 Tax=Bombina bombina TaxID=8345 RepID=UPI00235AE574|nr:M1-specific T cell receptor beta chain [Bombina bombina]